LADRPIELEPGDAVRVRIGVHTGEALQAEHDLFGRHVNLAARIADQAEGGEVLVSALTCDLLSGADDIVFGASREVTLKGVAEPQTVVSVAWPTDSVPNDIDAATAGNEDVRHAGTGT
jgi:class 3 adenylate cyclase